MQFFNSLNRQKEKFTPIDSSNVRMYVCGPTIYQPIHIGNARPLIVFDVLYRVLSHLYDRVTYVRNITDIDDKIMIEANKNKESIEALTGRTYAAFKEDCRGLGILEPDVEPRATEYVGQMVEMIDTLIKGGHAYENQQHVLFHTLSSPSYGVLSGRSRDEQMAGARVEVAPYKKDAADFVLWKPSDDGMPGWDSPWGRGRPGWHIECSAMSGALLGVPFDIHGGGIDLIFPHHENEIAQSVCAHSCEKMANYWLHNGFVDMSGEKMSKSIGNVVLARDALQNADSAELRRQEIVRLWMLSAHYRQPISYSSTGLAEAKTQLNRFYQAIRGLKISKDVPVDPEFLSALEDDLNSPQAIARLHELTQMINRADGAEKIRLASALVKSAKLAGLLQHDAEKWFLGAGDVDEDWINEQIDARKKAREVRDFQQADAIRKNLLDSGIVLEDSASGTTWRRS